MHAPTRDPNDATGFDSEVLTVDDLAKLLKVNRNTVYGLVKTGDIPGAVHLGRTIRIHGPTVLAWLSSSGQKHVSRDARRRAR